MTIRLLSDHFYQVIISTENKCPTEIYRICVERCINCSECVISVQYFNRSFAEIMEHTDRCVCRHFWWGGWSSRRSVRSSESLCVVDCCIRVEHERKQDNLPGSLKFALCTFEW